MRNTFILFLMVSLLSSCMATHDGYMNLNEKPASNDKKIGTAIGFARSYNILGFGGTNKNALILEAKNILYKSFPLQEGEYYANLTVDFKRSYILVYNATKVTLSADIMSAKRNEDKNLFLTPEFQNSRGQKMGDTITFAYQGAVKRGVILRFFEGKPIVGFFDYLGNFKTKAVEKIPDLKPEETKSLTPPVEQKGKQKDVYNIGDVIIFKIKDSFYKGEIINSDGNNFQVNYKDGIELKSTIIKFIDIIDHSKTY